MACWSAWNAELCRQVLPASVDSSIGTPGTQMWAEAAGSTQIRPNHQPYVDCELARNDVLVIRVQLVPLLVEVQKPRKFPVVSAAIAYRRAGSFGATAMPIRPTFVPAAGRP